jgi:hypothetical protein
MTGALLLCAAISAQSGGDGPQPVAVVPGALPGQPPSDAIVLFEGKDVGQWEYKDGRAAAWTAAQNAEAPQKRPCKMNE